jgi:antitoxin HicB
MPNPTAEKFRQPAVRMETNSLRTGPSAGGVLGTVVVAELMNELKIDPDAYPFELEQSADGMGWVIRYPDLPGCMAYGSTRAEAMANGASTIPGWIEAHAEHGIPLPEEYLRFKGNLRVRVPRAAHEQLTKRAAEDNISVNGLVEKILKEGLDRLTVSDEGSSGEWMQRLTPATHHALHFKAAEQSVSINTLIVALVAETVGLREREAA